MRKVAIRLLLGLVFFFLIMFCVYNAAWNEGFDRGYDLAISNVYFNKQSPEKFIEGCSKGNCPYPFKKERK